MRDALTRNWWVFLVRGLCAIAFGVTAFALPGVTILVLVMLYAAHALVDGVTAIVLAFGSRHQQEGWWAMLVVGIIGVLAGVGTFFWPEITVTVLLTFVAMWCIARGIFEIIAAIRLRKVIENEWVLGLAGAVSLAFGIALLAWPQAGLVTIAWLIGANAIAFGILSLILAFRLKSMRDRHSTQHPAPPGAMPA